MPDIEVAVPAPLPQTFTYAAPRDVAPGSRVVVPFGRRQVVAVALGPAKPTEAGIEIKPVTSVVDESPVYGKTLLELARWMSGYYLHPLGEVLRAMLPASSSKVVRESYTLSSKGQKLVDDPSSADGALLRTLFKKRPSLTAPAIKARLAKLAKTREPEETPLPPFKTLVAKGWLTKSRGTSMRARKATGEQEAAEPEVAETSPTETGPTEARASEKPTLTPSQLKVFEAIRDLGLRAPSPKPFLLHGVTGSGKTEVYLHLIEEAMRGSAEAQALVLVPEISLTPQMTRVFERRFPGLVAVVHSAMTDVERWTQMERVRRGEARILIGPRSAVFGPFRQLCLLIVDEEHDNSYKQSTGLTYNGRDVAVLRARLEGATVVLGSATPSMESYNNALTGRYHLLTMPERVTGRALPQIELVAPTTRKRTGTRVDAGGVVEDDSPEGEGEIPIAPEVVQALRDNLAEGHQAIVLVNRRGYAYYLFSMEERKPVECPQCSISMTLHARSTVLRCHYCDYKTTVAQVIGGREKETFVAVGYGSQKAEDLLKKKLPGARVVRLDSDVVVDRELLPQTLTKFRAREIDVLVGTQILAKGHDFPNVTLIVILEVDQLLGLPDFRAGERTFQLVVQAAGRAGRAELPGRVLIQTMRANHPVITTAIAQDYASFAQRELHFRQTHAYPPFSRMIALELNGEDPKVLDKLCDRIDGWMEFVAKIKPEVAARVRMLGPATPPIERVRSRYRRSLVLSSDHLESLRQIGGMFLAAFDKLPGEVRLRIDVDPQSLI